MKNKRLMVIGVTLILLALVATVAFAALREKDGVYSGVIEGRSPRLQNQGTTMYTEVYNDNGYAVRVDLSRTYNDEVLHRDVQFTAGETKHFAGSFYVSRVRR
jgi:hypothetical protein